MKKLIFIFIAIWFTGCLKADRINLDPGSPSGLGIVGSLFLSQTSNIPSYSVSGSASLAGLNGVLDVSVNGLETLQLSGTGGNFVFSTKIPDGTTYTISVIQRATFALQTGKKNWTTQSCVINGGSSTISGTVAGADLTISLSVSCTENPYVVDGTTGKKWMRCSQGQTWDAVKLTCSGATKPMTYCSLKDNSCNDTNVNGEDATLVSGHLNGTGTSAAWTSCNNLNTGSGTYGSTKWRVPRKSELESLVYCSDGTPTPLAFGSACSSKSTIPTIDSNLFPNTDTTNTVGAYWSSSEYSKSATANAVVVFFGGTTTPTVAGFGVGGSLAKTNTINIRCISD